MKERNSCIFLRFPLFVVSCQQIVFNEVPIYWDCLLMVDREEDTT